LFLPWLLGLGSFFWSPFRCAHTFT
jgi:hypothetical protein